MRTDLLSFKLMEQAPEFYTVITAAGMGRRFDGGKKKQFLDLGGKPLVEHSLGVLARIPGQKGIIIVVPKGDVEYTEKEVLKNSDKGGIIRIVEGDEHRWQSVKQGFKALPRDARIVAIHDGVRPFITERMVEKAVLACSDSDGACLAVPVKDTIKRAEGEMVLCTMDRSQLWQIQTPQVFNVSVLARAYETAEKKGNPRQIFGTDECFLVEGLNGSIRLIMGSYYNIKITTPEDFDMAEWIIKSGKYKNAG
jgi:2-C-methyl-D-erythritol 4-phosphate cytidylyltransferase